MTVLQRVAIRLLKTEQSTDFIKGLERLWVKHWPRPMVEESGHPPQGDPQAALQDLHALKARSTNAVQGHRQGARERD